MAIVFKDAQIFFAGYELTGVLNQATQDYSAEALDATVFGNDTRVRRGGLKVARTTASGFYAAGAAQPDPVLFDSIALSDAVVMVFPDGITEGSTSTGFGYMHKVTQSRFNHGGTIGDLLPFTFEAEGRGVDA